MKQLEFGLKMGEAGHGQTDVGKWERNEDDAPPMTPSRARSLAELTGVPVGWFFEPDLGELFGKQVAPSLEQDVAELRSTLGGVVELLAEMTETEPDEVLDRLTAQLDSTSPQPRKTRPADSDR